MSNIIEGITKDLKAIPKNLKTKVGDMDIFTTIDVCVLHSFATVCIFTYIFIEGR